MPCVWIKEALTIKGNKFKIDDVSFAAPVAELKGKLSESSGIDKQLQDFIFRGLILKDDQTLDSYGLKDGSTVYIIYKPESCVSEDRSVDLDIDLDSMMPVLETAITSPLYKEMMSEILKSPEVFESIVATTPGLIHDPVALTILRDPEMLQNLVDSGDVAKLAKEHPSLVQAASHLAAIVTKDVGTSGCSNLDDHDEDLMDIDPEMLAQAEMMAANEEQIQNRQSARGNTGRMQPGQPITSSYFASALQAARANLVSTSTQTAAVNAPPPSTGTSTQPLQQPISSEFFNQAMASALSASTERNNWQSELRQLREMGIEDEALSLRALHVTSGDVQAACDLIFSEGFD